MLRASTLGAMPEPRPSRSSRPSSKSGSRTTAGGRTPRSGYGKTSDQGRGASKRHQDSPSGRSLRRREAGEREAGPKKTSGGGKRAGGQRSGTAGFGRQANTRDANNIRSNNRYEERETPIVAPRKGWGSVARKGAAASMEEKRPNSSREAERAERPREGQQKEEWVPKKNARAPKERKERIRFVLPDDAIREIEKRAGKRAERLLRYLKDAGSAYAAERWADAKKALRPLLQEVPDAPVVQEMHGMVLYRQGKWAPAAKELELAHLATRSYDLYPAIMDSYRALRKWQKVESLWDELRAESPGAEITAEGRIVMAGALGDQKREQDAIRLLEKAPRPKNVQDHHVRTWYVLADMYDRAGETSKARSLFQKVAKHDPDLADVVERLEALD